MSPFVQRDSYCTATAHLWRALIKQVLHESTLCYILSQSTMCIDGILVLIYIEQL